MAAECLTYFIAIFVFISPDLAEITTRPTAMPQPYR